MTPEPDEPADPLARDPFDWQVTKDGRVRVFRGHREIVVVAGSRAARLVSALERAEPSDAQQLLARATGNYKHGNERRS